MGQFTHYTAQNGFGRRIYSQEEAETDLDFLNCVKASAMTLAQLTPVAPSYLGLW